MASRRNDAAAEFRSGAPEDAARATYGKDERPFGRASVVERALYIEELVAELERLSVGAELAPLRDLLGRARREARKQALRAAG